MYRKNFIVSLFVIAAFLTAGSLFASAQSIGPVRGKVQLKKADNTIVPIEGAEITAYRTDVSQGKLPSTKTDKKGVFSFAGVPIGQTFVIIATAPNIRAGFFPNVQANMGNIIIEVEAGDGTIPTEAEIRTVLASTTTTGELTPEEKKRQADLAKKSAEIQAKNERNKNANQIFNRAIGEGKKAYDAKDWDTAIAKFDEGYNADPEFAGSAPIFLNNKADALKQRAIASYQKSTTDAANKATLIEAMKKDLLDSIAASQKALDVLKNATSTEANVQKSYDNNRIVAYAIMSDSYRILIESRADESKIKEAVLAVDGYSGIESDAPKKTKAQIQMADAFRKIGKSDEAIPLYRKVLETSPDDSNALGGLGLSLFNSGAIAKAYGDSERNEAKKQEGIKLMQEGLDYMQRFVDTSPVKPDDTQQMKELKVSVKEAVDYIKTQEKLTPQKTNRPATNTKKRG